jgi:hypothetical protein
MAYNIKLFEHQSEYESYIVSDNKILPNVSYCEDTQSTHFTPYSLPNNVIVYKAPQKLAETTSSSTEGLHTNAFNVAITSHTFENGVGTIVFDGNVTTLGNYAFYKCQKMKSITLPNGVTGIGEYAFADSKALETIEMPDTVASIGKTAFRQCVFVTFKFPSSVTIINESVLNNCPNLTSVVIGSNVTQIGQKVFNTCSALTNVDIGKNVVSINKQAFNGCSSLLTITSRSMVAPSIQSDTFNNVKSGGTLYVPIASTGYDAWISRLSNWTKVEY